MPLSSEPQREQTYLLACVLKTDLNPPVHPCSLFRVFADRMKKLCVIDHYKCAQWRFWSDCANAQADLNLRWAHMSEGMFTDVVLCFVRNKKKRYFVLITKYARADPNAWYKLDKPLRVFLRICTAVCLQHTVFTLHTCVIKNVHISISIVYVCRKNYNSTRIAIQFVLKHSIYYLFIHSIYLFIYLFIYFLFFLFLFFELHEN